MKISYKELSEKFNLPDFTPKNEFRTDVEPVFYAWKFSSSLSAEKLWPLISETSLFNRYIGLSPRTETEKNGQKWVETTVFGVKQQWVEEPWTWIRGQSLEFVRNYTKGITRTVRCNMYLEPTESGVDFYVGYWWIPQSWAHSLFLKVTDSVIHDKFQQAVKAIEISLISKEPKKSPFSSALKRPNDPTKNVNVTELDSVVQKIKSTYPVQAAAMEGLSELIKFGDDVDVYRIRAIELAEGLGLKKRDMISACMQSVREGLLTISWDVVCPHCRGVRFEADTLGKLPPNSDCMVCEIDFETDTLESIEVTFHVNPSFRKVAPVLFCSAEASKKDHIQVQQLISAGGEIRFSLPLKEGRHRIRRPGNGSSLSFEVFKDQPNENIVWDCDSTEKIQCGPQPKFLLKNVTNKEISFSLEQLWWKDNILHPADVFAIQEFQDVFSRESLDAQVRLSLGVQTVMFTDIVNSTGFYNTRGDAAAFSAVRKHFTEVFELVGSEDGTVIKTIGDSVMACFLNADNAVKAAIKIQGCFDCNREDTPIRLRISLHSGQVIAVHLNQGLDLFGNSVNKAAKLQSCAGAGEIALSQELYNSCSPQILAPFRSHIIKRTSSMQYKELPLESQVLCYHEAKSVMTEARHSA